MGPFNLGPFEMVFIMVVLLLVFGAKRLPELGSGLGKGIREFKRSMNDIKTEMDRPEERKEVGAARPPHALSAESAERDKVAEPRNDAQ
ncbi:MAG: twin-arginine translocase TatA/TatE family subunit [Gemmatimonadota bacterium]